MRSLLLLALLALLASAFVLPTVHAAVEEEDDGLAAAAAAATEEPSTATSAGPDAVELVPFSAQDFFNGEWEIYRHVLTRSRGLSYGSSLPVVRWRLSKDNTTDLPNLVGRAVVNGTAGGYDSDEALSLRFELHDSATGRLQVGADDDHLRTLAPLAFEHVKGSMPLSAGQWHGADVAGDSDARYLLQISGNDRWTLTVLPSAGRTLAQVAQAPPAAPTRSAAEDDDDLSGAAQGLASTGHPAASEEELKDGVAFVYVAHRVRHEEPKTLFQKYGTMLLLGGMLIVNIWMRSKSGTNQLAQAQRSAAQPVPRARAAPQSNSGVRIEEIDSSVELPKKTK